MIIEPKKIESKNLTLVIRCPDKSDAAQLSELRIKIDSETENLDREPGEGILTREDFEKLIYNDSVAEKNIFLVVEAEGKLVGFARCQGNELARFRHKAEFGIGILKEYWGYGLGKMVLENILLWADSAGIEKICLAVVETNTKAIGLYKKFGFVEEGLLIKDRIHRDGNYYNTVMMRRLKN